jgi:hypothetical protein
LLEDARLTADKRRDWVRNAKLILLLGAPFALLTAYIYFHASLDTFVVYLLALTLWAGLFGYCVHIREKQPRKAGTIFRQR